MKLNPEDVRQFITPSPSKTPVMDVYVYNENEELIGEYETPAGFRLEQYVYSLYPNSEIQIQFSKQDGQDIFQVGVGLPGQDHFHVVHVGVYREPLLTLRDLQEQYGLVSKTKPDSHS